MQTAARFPKDQGERIQQYIRAKWRKPDNDAEIHQAGALLDEGLRARVDALGFEDEALLRVPPERVAERLEQLERDLEREDAFQPMPAGWPDRAAPARGGRSRKRPRA